MRLFFVFIFFVGITVTSKGQEIDGVWTDKAGDAFSNCYAIFSQQGDSIYFCHYLEWNGQPFVENGKGIRNGDTLDYHVTVTKQIPGWSTKGHHVLVISSNGQTLSGNYHDNKGNSGVLHFNRLFPKLKE